jgi:hypothetical protein
VSILAFLRLEIFVYFLIFRGDTILNDQATPVVKGEITILVAEYIEVGLLVVKLMSVVVEAESGVYQRPG